MTGNYDSNLYRSQKGWNPVAIFDFLSWMFKREYRYINSSGKNWFGQMVGPNIRDPKMANEAWQSKFKFKGTFGCINEFEVHGYLGAKVTTQGLSDFRKDFDPKPFCF